jgi:transposase
VRGLPRKSPETALLVEDETDLLLFPPLRSAWSKVGQTTEVRLSGWNARKVVFGAMDLRTGERLFHLRDRQRSEDFRPLLNLIRKQYGSRPVALLLDEDSSHIAKASLALANKLNIQLLWLPKRAPELNPMESLWRHSKDVVCANRQYTTIDHEARSFVRYLKSQTNEEALQLSGVRSPDFWLNDQLSKDFCGLA